MLDRPSLLDIETVVEETEIVVRPVGVLDVSTVELLVDVVRPHLADGRPVVVDVFGVTMCDSTGLGGIVSLEREARVRKTSFAVRNPRRHMARIIAMTGIDRVVRIDVAPRLTVN
jgi:anti-sigma B factor antagonist